MADNVYEMPEAPEKKKKTTLWIIIAVVAVVLICCCVVVVAGLIIAYTNGVFETDYYYLIPGLLSLA
jgi:flagellar basal body-associated protein FliL